MRRRPTRRPLLLDPPRTAAWRPQGRVGVRFVIAHDGSVSHVSVTSDGGVSEEVVKCVDAAFWKLLFPTPDGGSVTVSYPIVFTPGDAP
jgi:TonB family protein